MNVTAISISSSVIEVAWGKSPCADGYLITAVPLTADGGDDSEEIVSLNTVDDHATLEQLSPCKRYRIAVSAILHVDEANYFEGEGVEVTASTRLDLEAIDSYHLSSLKIRSGRASATFSWSRNEWPCAENETVLVCEEADKGNCVETIDDPKIIDDSIVFTVQHLKSCTSYRVSSPT